MVRRPLTSTRTAPLFPSTPLFRSGLPAVRSAPFSSTFVLTRPSGLAGPASILPCSTGCWRERRGRSPRRYACARRLVRVRARRRARPDRRDRGGPEPALRRDTPVPARESVLEGRSVPVREDLGGRRILQKKNP